MLTHQHHRVRQHIQRHRQPPSRLAPHKLLALQLLPPRIEHISMPIERRALPRSFILRHYHSFAAVSGVSGVLATGAFHRSTGFLAAVVSSSR